MPPVGGSTGSAGSLGGGSADRREGALPQGFLRGVGQGDFWDAPRGAARAAEEALGEDQPPVGRQLSPQDSCAGGGRGIFGMPLGGQHGQRRKPWGRISRP